MKTLIVIPARFASQRFPAKPLAMLKGASGLAKPLIQRAWEAACAVPDTTCVVATDDVRIQQAAQAFGAEVVMTSDQARNGTERCAEVARVKTGFDLVVNLQGDAPLTPAWFVSELIAAMAISKAAMATPVLRCDPETIASFRQDRAAGRVGGTTAVFDAQNAALYFSKEVLPYSTQTDATIFHHVGVYAYRPEVLVDYLAWPEGPLERQEGLEQLRFLEQGHTIQCVQVDGRGRAFWEVNNPEDIPRVEKMLAQIGIE